MSISAAAVPKAPANPYFRLLLPYVAGCDVLDIGSINHSFARTAAGRAWMFAFLEAHARRVTGIDNSAAEVAKARAAGHDILHADAETYRADRPWDVVMAGDVIEHLSNPGRFLDCARANLRPGGRLVISTPNTYALSELFWVLARLSNDTPVNAEHTCTFTPTTLRTLCARHGFTPEAMHYVNIPFGPGKRRWIRWLMAVNGVLTAPVPRFRQTMVAVFR
jgi:2-polyprenyl-3-methyl-5-hydroxy-6-metoxy-1,4-benzoquinol methylase